MSQQPVFDNASVLLRLGVVAGAGGVVLAAMGSEWAGLALLAAVVLLMRGTSRRLKDGDLEHETRRALQFEAATFAVLALAVGLIGIAVLVGLIGTQTAEQKVGAGLLIAGAVLTFAFLFYNRAYIVGTSPSRSERSYLSEKLDKLSPHECAGCGWHFRTAEQLKAHVKKHHPT